MIEPLTLYRKTTAVATCAIYPECEAGDGRTIWLSTLPRLTKEEARKIGEWLIAATTDDLKG